MSDSRSLEPPPIAGANSSAYEVLRVWGAPGLGQQTVLLPTWEDPAAWGLLLADVARHAANAYSTQGFSPEEAMTRIRSAWDAEWSPPTDDPIELR